jgi:hypothetical protein
MHVGGERPQEMWEKALTFGKLQATFSYKVGKIP